MKKTSSRSRTLRLMVLLAVLIPLLSSVPTFAAQICDQVELKATHADGIPFHTARWAR